MGEAIISRRGGASRQTLAPTITKVSDTLTSITFTLTNNDASTATLVYRFSSILGNGQSISVAGDTTTSNITISGLDRGASAGTLFVTANVTGKIKSEVAEAQYDQIIVYTAATGGTTLEYDDGGKRYKSHTFTSDDDFIVTTAGNGGRNNVDVLVIAGGAGGGGANVDNVGGGGGAGGYKSTITPTPSDTTVVTKPTVTATTYGVVIGSGGSGGSGFVNGSNGTNSSALSVVATGGGFGAVGNGGGNGGSGGGGGGASRDPHPGGYRCGYSHRAPRC